MDNAHIVAWKNGEHARPQNFALPLPLIRYLIKSAPAEVLIKLFQCCKWFFEQNPMIIAASFDGSLVCPNFECNGFLHPCRGSLNIDFRSIWSDVWISRKFFLSNPLTNQPISQEDLDSNLEMICNKLSVRNHYDLDLVSASKTINFEIFKVLAANAKKINIGLKIIRSNQEVVPFEEILQFVSNVESFSFESSDDTFDASTFKKIAALDKLGTIKSMRISKLKASADLIYMRRFIKKNSSQIIVFSFEKNTPMDDEYKEELKTIIAEILEDRGLKCLISYSGQNLDNFTSMERRIFNY